MRCFRDMPIAAKMENRGGNSATKFNALPCLCFVVSVIKRRPDSRPASMIDTVSVRTSYCIASRWLKLDHVFAASRFYTGGCVLAQPRRLAHI